jgi:hypothetical protein
MRSPDSAPANWKPSRAHFREHREEKDQVTAIKEDHEILESIEIDKKENGLKRGFRKMTRFGHRVIKKIERWAKGFDKKIESKNNSRDEVMTLPVNHVEPTAIHFREVAKVGGRKRGVAISYPNKVVYDRDEGMGLVMTDREETR